MGNALNNNIIWVVRTVLTPDPELFDLAHKGSWAALIERAVAQPQEAIWRDRCGNTSLHLACRRDPPVDVIVALLRANRLAASMQTIDWMTPLHLACYCGSSIDVVRLLIEANRDAVTSIDRRGRTPLHCAAAGYRTPDKAEIIKLLLEIEPSNCRVSDDRGRTPLYLMLDDYAEEIHEQIRTMKSNDNENMRASNGDTDITEEYMGELDQCWNCVQLLLKAAYHGTVADPLPNGEQFRIVHACIGVPGCPPYFIHLALHLWPEQVKAKDRYGNFPLHIAAACPRPIKSDTYYVIEAILTMYPEAARFPGYRGALPLKLAIESRKSWNPDVKVILEAYPAALATIDLNIQHYPDILEMISRRTTLNILYRVLLSKPEILCNLKSY